MILFETILILGVAVAAAFWWHRAAEKRSLRKVLSQNLLLVKIPRNKESKDAKAEINIFEGFIANLAALNEPFSLELAVPYIGQEIHFYVAAPRRVEQALTRQIHAVWPDSSVEAASDDYNIFTPQGIYMGGYVEQKEDAILPIRTYAELNLDPFAGILGGFAEVKEMGEGAALQIIARPAGKADRNRLVALGRALNKGKSLKEALHARTLWGFFKTDQPPKTAPGSQPKLPQRDEEAVKGASIKLAKPLFRVNVRILASAREDKQAESIFRGIAAGFEQFASPVRNALDIVRMKNARKLVYQFVFRVFDPRHAMLLTSEEIASMYHFPISTTAVPQLKLLKAKEAEPPANLPKAGTLLGESVFRGTRTPVYISDEDRGRHIYLIGQTGTGKSTLLANMVIEDIRSGKGLAIIDPHGDLIESILRQVPDNRAGDVIHFNPGDLWRPLGLNMLDYNADRPEEKTFIVNEMQGIFNKLFAQETMGPMFEQYMRNALLLLMEDMANEPATLIEVPRVFTDVEYRKRKLARIANTVVIDFWEKEAVKAGGEASLANMTPYITSKFNNFISNDYMRPIIGQPKSAFNFREVMDSGKILLVNLSKGRIGDINAGLLGMIISGKILMAALSRVDTPMDKRRDFNLYIDEFQSFTTDSIASILSEARKYRLTLTVAHQFIKQLDDKVKSAVFGNVGTQVVFRVGAEDSEFLAKQFEPVFGENDLTNIDNLNAYVKMLIGGQTAKPFNMKILGTSWEKGSPELGEKIKEMSRENFGAKREEIEAAINKRLRE